MTEESNLEPLPVDVLQALEVERSRPDLPRVSQARLVSRIEATNEFVVATSSQARPGASESKSESLVGTLRRPLALALLAGGVVWGAAMGAAVVALGVPVPETRWDSPQRARLQDAQVALSQGRAAQALELVERHARDFPSSAVEDEREFLAIQALVATQRQADAVARAAAFRRRFPGHALTPLLP